MRFSRFHRQLTAWIALLAIVMAAFAPTLSQAMAVKAAMPWMEICSAADGASAHAGANIGKGVSESPATRLLHLEHCPICSMHGGMPAVLPTVKLQAVPVSERVVALPVLFLQAPRTPFIWSTAQSRAPPTVS